MTLNRSAWIAQGFVGLCLLTAGAVHAQIAPDGTLGAERSQVNSIAPGNERVEGGALRGVNLFHSFREFNVREGSSVYFANPAVVQNIFSRVTGGNVSNVNGTLGVLGTANLFLLNPNGIIFGPNARLDVAGSFFASTASGFTFPDGSEFSATNPQATPLLTVSLTPGLQGGTPPIGNISNAGSLAVPQGKTLTLFGNTVTSTGILIAPGGTVQMLGDRVGLLDGARIDVSSNLGGGTVFIGGDFQGKGTVPNAIRTFVAPRATINADAPENGNGGRVIVWADEATGFYGKVSARGGSNTGNGGFVEVSGKQNLTFRGKVDLSAVNGSFGTLLLDPTDIRIVNGTATPNTDDDQLTDDQILQTDGGGASFTISETTLEQLPGNANVILQATNDIVINDLADNALVFAPGNGTISLQANADGINTGSVLMNPGDAIRASGRSISISGSTLSLGNIESFAFFANGGDVTLTATNGNLTVGNIDSYSAFSVEGGDVTLKATGDITTRSGIETYADSGRSGSVDIKSDLGFINTTAGAIDSSSRLGKAGTVGLSAKGNVDTSWLISGGPVGGNITIISDAAFSSTDSLILSGSISGSFLDTAGDITIRANSASLNGTQIISGTIGDAQAGNITISARDFIRMEGVSTGEIPSGGAFTATVLENLPPELQFLRKSSPSQVVALTLGSGSAGNIQISANTLVVKDGSILSPSSGRELLPQNQTQRLGQAGNLRIDAKSIEVIGTALDGNPSRLATGTFSTGNSGNLAINTERLLIRDGGIVATSSIGRFEGAGQSGNLTVNATDYIEMVGTSNTLFKEERIPSAISTDTFGSGIAGNLKIDTNRLIVRDGAVISVSTFGQADGGSMNINALESIELSGAGSDGLSSGLYAQAFAGGNAGDIQVSTRQLTIRNQAKITVASGSATDNNIPRKVRALNNIDLSYSGVPGNAGKLEVIARTITLDNRGTVLASSGSSEGGNIELQVRDALLLRRSSLISATAGTQQAGGNGGNITIAPSPGAQFSPFIISVPSENSDITANAFSGRGGRVDITAQTIFGLFPRSREDLLRLLGSPPLDPARLPTNDITAISQGSPTLDGVVAVNTIDLDPSRGLTPLPTGLDDPSKRIDTTCASGSGKSSGQFVITGRGGLPPNPSDPLTPDATLPPLATSPPDTRSTQTNPSSENTSPEAIVEAQGFVRLPNGRIRFVAQSSTVTPHNPWQVTPNCSNLPRVSNADRPVANPQ